MSEIAEGTTPTPEQKQLVALFIELEKGQLELLDAAAQRLIGLTSTLLGVLLAITAFGDRFPPAYLRGSGLTKAFVVIALVGFLGATLLALLVAQPRSYTYGTYKPAEMKATMTRIIATKGALLQWAGAMFYAGLTALAALILTIVVTA